MMELQDLPDKVEDRAKDIKDDNPDMDKSTAIAIARDQLNMARDDDDCPSGNVKVGDKCISIEDVEDVPPSALDMSSPRILSNRQLRGPIEREERDDGSVVFKNLKVLTEGIWTDANSREPIHYIPENLSLEEDNTVNLLHDTDNEVSEVGHMENDTTEDGAKYVDVVLHRNNPASEYADENLQKALETKGQKGFGGPSVEIPAEGQEIEPDGPEGVPAIKAGKIDGLGLVGNQADDNVGFEQQTRNRQVALSSPKAKVYTTQNKHMEGDIREAILSRELQIDEIQDDAENIADELDVPISEVMEILDPLMADNEDMGDDEGEEEEDTEMEHGEEDDEEEEEDMNMMDDGAIESIEEQIDDIWGKIEEIEETMMGEEMSSELAEAKAELSEAIETIDSLEDEKEELEKRLSNLENESKGPKTLAEGDESTDWDPEYDTSPSQFSSW